MAAGDVEAAARPSLARVPTCNRTRIATNFCALRRLDARYGLSRVARA